MKNLENISTREIIELCNIQNLNKMSASDRKHFVNYLLNQKEIDQAIKDVADAIEFSLIQNPIIKKGSIVGFEVSELISDVTDMLTLKMSYCILKDYFKDYKVTAKVYDLRRGTLLEIKAHFK